MIQLPEGFDSIFRYIVVVSQRAEQLINGAKPRAESVFKKLTLKARDDVDEGEVSWRILTQEELDAHRQAMVEQYRAEVDAASEESVEPIPDVLPTAGIPAPVIEGSDRDDELVRLQKLLGMTRAAAELSKAVDEAAEKKKSDDSATSDADASDKKKEED